ncbi:hypothetical protein M2132_000006 [Dysgonomonas sp. PH5-45]|uniref:hypothetical protein n=1 Tax=unclassified Dysgonomonas TaxID=2630389 RepID=UPI002475D1F5|nr:MULTISPECIES: hypothetical protein [unclassified Dysgonomonas]MDH6353689.1 hypothetical protein [Dysgonomonas sp. PH5-45]MDH6386592.1 hypothetical protein [Dysgonomonas sp. PH5-37]
MINKFFLFSISIIFVFIACNSQSKQQKSQCESSIKSVRVLYFNNIFETSIAIPCNYLLKNAVSQKYNPNDNMGIIDTLITDCEVIKKIEKGIELIANNDNDTYSEDARMHVIIMYENNQTVEFCITGYYAQNMLKSGILQSNSKELLYLLKHYSGYYLWIPSTDLKYMKELNDSIR